MNNDKFDAITGDKFVCCCDCGKWFPSTKAFTKFYSSTAFMLCSKCANKLEQDIRRYKVEEAPTAAVVEVRHGQWIRKEDDSCYWYECSECGEKLAKTQWGNDYFSAYCPNCGTLMDKEEPNEM